MLERRPQRQERTNILPSAHVAFIAGTLSTAIFAASTMPMVLKAARTKDLSSYSGGNLVLSNLGNLATPP